MENQKTNLSNFIIIDNTLLLDKRLSSTDILLYGIIQSLSNNKKRCCYASNKFLANMLDLSTRNVQACISKLKNLKYINVEINRNNSRIIKTDLDTTIVKRNEYNGFYNLDEYDWLNDNND